MQMTTFEKLRSQEDGRGLTKISFRVARRMSQPHVVASKPRDRVQGTCTLRRKGCINTRVFNALKPLMLTCYATGILFHVDFSRDGIRKYFTPTHLYSVLIMTFLAANVARHLMTFDSNETFDIGFVMKLALNVFNVECFAHFVCFYVASCSYKRLPEFFIEWEKIQSLFSIPLTSIHHQAYIYTAILGMILIVVNGGNGYISWGNAGLQDMMIVPMEVDDPHITIMKVVNLVFCAYQTLAWLTPSIFMHMVAKILSQEFDNITKQLKEIRDSGVIKAQEILESTRRHHQRLCKLVGHADDIFSMQIAVTFCGSFAMVCLGMYICIYSTPAGTSRTLVLIMWSFWLVMGLARILLDCVSGAMLNAAVSKIRVMPCV